MQGDAGICELVEVERYTMSKMTCWTALDRAVLLAEQHQIDTQHADRWRRERDRIRDWVDTNCWSDAKQSYTMYPGSDCLDAAVLLATQFSLERKDRLAATRDPVVRGLAAGPLIYRYTGMDTEEGTFTACGVWLAEGNARFTAYFRANTGFSPWTWQQSRGSLTVLPAIGPAARQEKATAVRFSELLSVFGKSRRVLVLR